MKIVFLGAVLCITHKKESIMPRQDQIVNEL